VSESYESYTITVRVIEKRLADPHIDVTFSNKLTVRFTTGEQAKFAQELRMGESIAISFAREEK